MNHTDENSIDTVPTTIVGTEHSQSCGARWNPYTRRYVLDDEGNEWNRCSAGNSFYPLSHAHWARDMSAAGVGHLYHEVYYQDGVRTLGKRPNVLHEIAQGLNAYEAGRNTYGNGRLFWGVFQGQLFFRSEKK